MFGKLFSKKSKSTVTKSEAQPKHTGPITTHRTAFLEDVTGDITSIEFLRFEATKILTEYPDITNAWFSKVMHGDEENTRVALIVEGIPLSNDVGMGIATKLSEFISIDVMFAASMSKDNLAKVNQQSASLFREDCHLYVVPAVVKHGANPDMPKDWVKGIQMYIIAEKDIDLAMHRAMAEIDIQQFEYVTIYNEKILGVETEGWWDNFVMDRFTEQKDLLPTQSDVEALVKTGGLKRGVCMQLHDADPDGAFE